LPPAAQEWQQRSLADRLFEPVGIVFERQGVVGIDNLLADVDTFTFSRGLLISTGHLRLVDVCNTRSGSVVVK
ncbi:MAG: hypothetical protein QOK44_2031, partial [Betaproteobacteria bacterium]|nr:hypothetical protein [Betaproteobacteria bacterium]